MKSLLKKVTSASALMSFFNKKELSHLNDKYRELGLKKKYWHRVSHTDFKHLPKNENWLDLKNSRNMLPGDAIFELFSEEHKAELLNWSDNGFVILRTFFSEGQIDKTNAEIDALINQKKATWSSNKKIINAYKQASTIKDLAENGPLKQICQMLLGQNLNLYQSANFLEATDRKTHTDSIHLSTYPQGNLITAWVALEDISLDHGPLHYYRSSHALPYIVNEDLKYGGAVVEKENPFSFFEKKVEQIISSKHLKKEVFIAKKGDVFVTHANLLHGSEPHLNPELSRKSMVFQYYADNAICYNEITQKPAIFNS